MSLKRLINNQTIRIDDHKRGSREAKNWDDPSADVHIDKSTNFRYEGKRRKIRIRIPINSDRPIKIGDERNQEIERIPHNLKREIQDALENKEIREEFIRDVVETLKNFTTALSSEQQVRTIIRNLSKHFELQWTEDKIATYTNDILQIYTQILQDETKQEFFMTIDKKKIIIGQNTGYARHQKSIRNR